VSPTIRRISSRGLRPEGIVVVVAGVDDFRRVDAVQTNVRVAIGEDDRVAVDYPHGAGERAEIG
jgi:hypothetical protein